jgi:hypothetical protein
VLGSGQNWAPDLSVAEWTTIHSSFRSVEINGSLVARLENKATADDAAAQDNFGCSVAVSGDTAIVGVCSDDPVGVSGAGSVRVLERNQGGSPDDWRQVAVLTATVYIDGQSDYGRSVSISGDTIVVGAPTDNLGGGGASGPGAAYVYARNHGGADNWGYVTVLTATIDAESGDLFGYSVAVSGDTVVVGAYWDSHASGEGAGSAYVFERNQGGPDAWGLVQKLTASDATEYDSFGSSVAISGDTIVVGAENAGSGGIFSPPPSGSAYVFARNQGGPDNWGQVGRLVALYEPPGIDFGCSVGISGDTVVVGAMADPIFGVGVLRAGAAYIFERNSYGVDLWGYVQTLSASDPEEDDWFGYSVAISGDAVVVGSLLDDDAGSDSGSAYVFERNHGGADNWAQVQKLVASDAEVEDYFGYRVAISGDTIVVGSPEDDDACPLDPECDSGSAYVFRRGGIEWEQQAKPTADDGASDDSFGFSVSLSGDTAVVGAYMKNTQTGAAYVLERNQDGVEEWGRVQTLTASGVAPYDWLGYSVSLSRDTAVVGAPGDESGRGTAYVFERNQGGSADNWGEVAVLSVTVKADAGDNFGWAVAISGDTAVVGAPQDDANRGRAYVFERNQGGSADNWGQVAVLSATLYADPTDNFGWAVAISGDTIVVGAPGDDSDYGAAYVFERNQGGADQWGQVHRQPGSVTSGEFGRSVAISDDTVVVGAPEVDTIYILGRNQGGADQWGIVTTKTGNSGTYFGGAVAISGDDVAVGAPNASVQGNQSGRVHVFERNHGGMDQWNRVQGLIGGDTVALDYFGTSVAISGDAVLVGVPYDDDAGNASGSAYVFRFEAAKTYLPLVLRDS